MRDPEDLLRQVTRDLQALRLGWAVVGALAVGARSEPRFTRDVDVAIAVADDAEAEATARALRERGYKIFATVEQERTGRLATVRLLPPEAHPDDPTLDVIFASSGIEAEVVGAAEEIEVFPDQRVPIASTGHMIALKLLSRSDRRVLDERDLQELLAAADDAEIARAREAVRLISDRGYARDRDLEAALDEAIARWGTEDRNLDETPGP